MSCEGGSGRAFVWGCPGVVRPRGDRRCVRVRGGGRVSQRGTHCARHATPDVARMPRLRRRDPVRRALVMRGGRCRHTYQPGVCGTAAAPSLGRRHDVDVMKK
uniref:Uncharacterized protein n=1 Tax=Burkholderia orbicola (strain AU 1054) TaxID=331271 RepID=A0A0H2XYT1_BURO1